MLGAGFSYLIEQAKSFMQRQALIYGLMAAAGLLFIFAAGYGLDAVRAMLMIRVGGVYASLIVSGGLLVFALVCFGAGTYLSRSSSPDAIISKASASLPKMPHLPPVTGSAMLAGGAVTGLVAGILAARMSWRRSRHLSHETHDEQVDRAPGR